MFRSMACGMTEVRMRYLSERGRWWSSWRSAGLWVSVCAVLVLLASFAIAMPVLAAQQQGGKCDAFSDAKQLGTAAYSDAEVLVPACGPLPGVKDKRHVYPYTGGFFTEGYQCVEFSVRFIYYKFHLPQKTSSNGDQI